MNDNSSNQALSDKAYEEVLRNLRLPPGTKLHEDPDRVECWQRYFALFRALAEALKDATESEDPLLREAAE